MSLRSLKRCSPLQRVYMYNYSNLLLQIVHNTCLMCLRDAGDLGCCFYQFSVYTLKSRDFPKPANSLPLGVAHETKKYYVADERTQLTCSVYIITYSQWAQADVTITHSSVVSLSNHKLTSSWNFMGSLISVGLLDFFPSIFSHVPNIYFSFIALGCWLIQK